MSLLERIVTDKRLELERRRREQPLEVLQRRAAQRSSPPPFAAALRRAPMGLIAEIKPRSPSAGAIRLPFDGTAIVGAYERAGAQAVSCLVDETYFGGGEALFAEVRAACSLPMLYKEFVVDTWQVWHAASLGASALLLIAAVLDEEELAVLIAESSRAGLEVLLEVHDAEEMAVARRLEAPLVGVNNRDLNTFSVDIGATLTLTAGAPPGALLVSESGIRTAQDVVRLRDGGAGAILVGQQLLQQADPAAAVAELMERVWTSS